MEEHIETKTLVTCENNNGGGGGEIIIIQSWDVSDVYRNRSILQNIIAEGMLGGMHNV